MTTETIFIHVDAFFGWKDRLRILCGRPARIRVRQNVWQKASGSLEYDQATSSVYVESIRPRKLTGAYDSGLSVVEARRLLGRIGSLEAALRESRAANESVRSACEDWMMGPNPEALKAAVARATAAIVTADAALAGGAQEGEHA